MHTRVSAWKHTKDLQLYPSLNPETVHADQPLTHYNHMVSRQERL